MLCCTDGARVQPNSIVKEHVPDPEVSVRLWAHFEEVTAGRLERTQRRLVNERVMSHKCVLKHTTFLITI